MDISKYEVQGTTFDICPVCKNGRVYNYQKKGFLKITKSNLLMCEKCYAKFIDEGLRERQPLMRLDLSDSQKGNKYSGQSLKKSEWIRGISDIDLAVQNQELPNYIIDGLNIMLQDGESTHFYARASMLEERAVRNYVGGSVRVMKGVYVRGGQAESHGELREIDNGATLLTNKRLIFDGASRKIEYNLPKIISLTEYEDSFQIGVSNRKKSQVFIVDEPHKWVTYIQLATKLNQDITKVTKTKSPTPLKKKDNEIIKILNLRYAKGEISKEEYEQMKRDING